MVEDGIFTEFSLWNQLLSMLNTHEEELNGKLDLIVAELDESGKARFRAAFQQVRDAIPKLLGSSQKLVIEDDDPAIGAARQALTTVYLDDAFLLQALEVASMSKRIKQPPHEDVALARMLIDLLRARSQCELAYHAIEQIGPAAERSIELLALAARAKPGPLAQRYLSRVARCYAWGYEAETLILCRSVLEQVLEEAVEDMDVFNAFGCNTAAFPAARHKSLRERDPFRVAIGDRNCAAGVLGILTETEADLARQIRDRGDKAVHEEPPAGTDVTGTIQALTGIVAKLCGQEKGRSKG